MFSLKQPQPALPEITSQQLSVSISPSKSENDNKLSSHTDVLKQNILPDFTFFPILVILTDVNAVWHASLVSSLLLCCVEAGPGCYQANDSNFVLGRVQPNKM